jgi:hypothetical protein
MAAPSFLRRCKTLLDHPARDRLQWRLTPQTSAPEQEYPLSLTLARWLKLRRKQLSDFREPLLPPNSISAAHALKPENRRQCGIGAQSAETGMRRIYLCDDVGRFCLQARSGLGRPALQMPKPAGTYSIPTRGGSILPVSPGRQSRIRRQQPTTRERRYGREQEEP